MMRQKDLVSALENVFYKDKRETALSVLARCGYTPEVMVAAKADYDAWVQAFARLDVLQAAKGEAKAKKDEIRALIRKRMAMMADAARALAGHNHPLLVYLDLQTLYTSIDLAEEERDPEDSGTEAKGKRQAKRRPQSQTYQMKHWLIFVKKLPLPPEFQAILDKGGWTAERLNAIPPLVTRFREALEHQHQTKVNLLEHSGETQALHKKLLRWYRLYARLVRAELRDLPNDSGLKRELGLSKAS
jgi:hypothetical protein